ncbi:MAG: threonine ammonia-lyase [Deltaproteobacteria bacterium]|nr:threonine ammonia-lyase [Deltaproteobacteria bacterium]
MITKLDIEKAYLAIRDQVFRTPLVYSQKLSQLCGCQTLFKLENLQITGSFKERGALYKLLSLSVADRARGVIAASAGNHAQAVAYHCQRLGIQAKIITIGKELLQEDLAKGVDAVVCPIGGGGLISGIAIYLKETMPDIKIIGVQASNCPSMKQSLAEGRPVRLPSASSLADGITIKRVEPLNLSLVQKYVDEVVTADEDQIANAILLLLEMEKIVTEGAGAIPLAAIMNRKAEFAGQKVISIISGGNIDVNILGRIITRGLAAAGRVAQFTLRIRDLPGSLLAVLEIVKKMQINILDIMHHRLESPAPFGFVDVSLTLETKGHAHIEEIKQTLNDAGYPPQICLPG